MIRRMGLFHTASIRPFITHSWISLSSLFVTRRLLRVYYKNVTTTECRNLWWIIRRRFSTNATYPVVSVLYHLVYTSHVLFSHFIWPDIGIYWYVYSHETTDKHETSPGNVLCDNNYWYRRTYILHFTQQ